jgi:hypothetical protein
LSKQLENNLLNKQKKKGLPFATFEESIQLKENFIPNDIVFCFLNLKNNRFHGLVSLF